MKALTITAGAVFACIAIAGCASKPPTELKSARAAYNDAANSPGAGAAQADVYEAKKSLDRAELSFNEDGDSPETRDLAYIAERKALIAKSNGNTAISMQAKRVALQDAQRWKEEQAQAMRNELGQTKIQLETAQKLDAEQRAKIEALGAKMEQRGLVLTISGSVLFQFGKSELMPAAAKRLDDVVAALKDNPRNLTIVGHTDSVGSDESNMKLSQKRAESVRNYLVAHGIPENRVVAEGEGEKNPIADNKTAEGRANNRRVEVIVNLAPNAPLPMPGQGEQKQPQMQQRP